MNSLDYSSCSILAVYFNLKNGKTDFSPKWIGFEQTFTFIDSVILETNELGKDYDLTFTDWDNTIKNYYNINDLLREFEEKYGKSFFSNFYPLEGDEAVIFPEYIYVFIKKINMLFRKSVILQQKIPL